MLCPTCAGKLARADWHVPGVARSTVADGDASAWLIDPWGQLHPLSDEMTVGRDDRGDALVVTDRQVSRVHAIVRRRSEIWIVRDRSSHNGTHVNELGFLREAELHHLDRIRFANLEFYFWNRARPPDEATVAPLLATANPGPASYRLRGDADQVITIAARLGYPAGEAPGQFVYSAGAEHKALQLALSRLQHQFLRLLCERWLRDQRLYDDAVSGGFVATHELKSRLPFQSPSPQTTHVRQVVSTLRKLLNDAHIAIGEAGATTLVEGKSGMGYRLTWPVEVQTARPSSAS